MSEKVMGVTTTLLALRCGWLAEVQGGQTIGATDELGLYATEDNFTCMIFTPRYSAYSA